jgi:hypothetical protein
MPVQVDRTTYVKFTYRPDYLRGYEHLITGEDVCRQFAFLDGLQNSDIRLDGGNVVASGRRVILTEKGFRENPSWPRKKVREELWRASCRGRCHPVTLVRIGPRGRGGELRFLDHSRGRSGTRKFRERWVIGLTQRRQRPRLTSLH